MALILLTSVIISSAQFADGHQQIELRLYAIMFFSIDYTRLCTIISDYTRLFYYKNSNDYTRLFHYLTKDDYFTYFTTIISLIFFRTYYCNYCDYTQLCALFLSQAIICIILFEMSYCDYCFQSQLCALCALLRDYSNYVFVLLL